MSTEFKSILKETDRFRIFEEMNTDVENASAYYNEADAFVLNVSASLVSDFDKMTHMMMLNAAIHMMDIMYIKGVDAFNVVNYLFPQGGKYNLIREQIIAIYTNSSKRDNFTTVDGKKLYIRELEMIKHLRNSNVCIDLFDDDILKRAIAACKAIEEKFGDDSELKMTVEGCYSILNARMHEELSKVKMPYSTAEKILDHVILYTGAFTLGWCIGSLIGHVILALSSNTGGAALYASTPGLTVMPA